MVFCLSFHARYVCAHAGACCTAGWPIPVEQPLIVALAARGLSASPVLDVDARGRCVFFEPDRGRLCAIHRQAGPELLPSACRHFPRVVLNDPRGTFVTLSHFCPTAAGLLLDAGTIEIVEAAASLSGPGPLEGLDARGVLPPLLRPGLLMDCVGYAAWEALAIGTLDRPDLGPEAALDAIAAWSGYVRTWNPGSTSLENWIRDPAREPGAWHLSRKVPGTLSGGDRVSGTVSERGEERPVKAFVAAHLFASWAAYQNGGLDAVVFAGRSALAHLRAALARGLSFIEAAAAADLVLRHTQSPATAGRN